MQIKENVILTMHFFILCIEYMVPLSIVETIKRFTQPEKPTPEKLNATNSKGTTLTITYHSLHV